MSAPTQDHGEIAKKLREAKNKTKVTPPKELSQEETKIELDSVTRELKEVRKTAKSLTATMHQLGENNKKLTKNLETQKSDTKLQYEVLKAGIEFTKGTNQRLQTENEKFKQELAKMKSHLEIKETCNYKLEQSLRLAKQTIKENKKEKDNLHKEITKENHELIDMKKSVAALNSTIRLLVTEKCETKKAYELMSQKLSTTKKELIKIQGTDSQEAEFNVDQYMAYKYKISKPLCKEIDEKSSSVTNQILQLKKAISLKSDMQKQEQLELLKNNSARSTTNVKTAIAKAILN